MLGDEVTGSDWRLGSGEWKVEGDGETVEVRSALHTKHLYMYVSTTLQFYNSLLPHSTLVSSFQRSNIVHHIPLSRRQCRRH